MEEKKKNALNYEEIVELRKKEGKEVNSIAFWKYLLLELIEDLMEQGTDEFNIDITKEDLDTVVTNVMEREDLWETIDRILSEEIQPFETKFLGEDIN